MMGDFPKDMAEAHDGDWTGGEPHTEKIIDIMTVENAEKIKALESRVKELEKDIRLLKRR